MNLSKLQGKLKDTRIVFMFKLYVANFAIHFLSIIVRKSLWDWL